MKLDLIALTRHEYARLHPERDTRQMPVDDTLFALASVVENELERLKRRVSVIEAKLSARDPE